MRTGETPYSTSVFSVDVAGLDPHPNPVTCVVMGRRAPVTIETRHERVVGDILIIRPGVEHRVSCEGGLSAMYLDGIHWRGADAVAERLEGPLAQLAEAAMGLRSDAQRALRERLGRGASEPEERLAGVLTALATEPMIRMTQAELSRRMGIERTQALRVFKAETGLTFRQFKRWIGLQHAARRVVAGDLVRTAALDAGFADTAHLTRTFKQSFGLTPSQAIAALPPSAARDLFSQQRTLVQRDGAQVP